MVFSRERRLVEENVDLNIFFSKISLKDCSTIAILDLDRKQKLTKYCGQPCKANTNKPSALCFIGNFLKHSEWLTVYINRES